MATSRSFRRAQPRLARSRWRSPGFYSSWDATFEAKRADSGRYPSSKAGHRWTNVFSLDKPGSRAVPNGEAEAGLSREITLVTGAGGFIGGHLVADLVASGQEVRAVDIKPLADWYRLSPEAENRSLDLRSKDDCMQAARGASQVYNLAADMGGM